MMRRVLIIDDEKDVGNLFKIYLEKSGEYQIDVYTDPVDALYYFKKGLYDLVLLDLKMPQIDGISMYQQLKKVDSNTGSVNLRYYSPPLIQNHKYYYLLLYHYT